MPRVYMACIYAETFISDTPPRIHSLRIRGKIWPTIGLISRFKQAQEHSIPFRIEGDMIQTILWLYLIQCYDHISFISGRIWMFLNFLKSAGQSDRGPLCPAYAEPAYTQRCVTDKCSRIYTAYVYAGHSGVNEL